MFPKLLLVLLALPTLLPAQLIPANLKIRVERPDRISPPITGTASNCYRGKDNYFNEIQLGANNFLSYTANGFRNTDGSVNDYSTCRIQGNQVYNMGGAYAGTIPSGNPNDPASAFASCGYWLNGTYKSGATYYGFAHAEGYGNTTYGQYCGYPPTTKSMALLTSTDGVSWTLKGQILANPTAQSPSGSELGEGDCTPVPFAARLYQYCRRVQDTQTSVARASLTGGFGKSTWKKYWNGSWTGTWNGDDSPLGLYGSSASIFGNYGNVALLRSELGGTNIQGVAISFSSNSNGTAFTAIPEPLIYEDLYQFPDGSYDSDFVGYPAALSASDGSRVWNDFFLLSYTFVPNRNDALGAPDLGRTLVMRNVSVSQQTNAQSPQVGIALSRWYSASIGQRVSSVQAVPYNYANAGYAWEPYNASPPYSPYLMTVPPASGPKTVVECVSTAGYPNPANPDHLVNSFATGSNPPNRGCDTNYAFLRTAGYLYANSQGTGTVLLYRCKPGSGPNGTTNSHFVSLQADCEGKGIEEYPLGYALAN